MAKIYHKLFPRMPLFSKKVSVNDLKLKVSMQESIIESQRQQVDMLTEVLQEKHKKDLDDAMNREIKRLKIDANTQK